MLIKHYLHQIHRGVCLARVIQRQRAKHADEWILWLSRIVELTKNFVEVAHVHMDQSTIVTSHDVRSRIQTNQAIITAKRASIFAIQPVQCCLHKMHHGFVRRFLPSACNFFASLLFVTTPQVNEDHQHARLENIPIDCERLAESRLRSLVIFRTAKALEDAIHITSSKPVVRQRKIWIQLYRPHEMLDGGSTIFRRCSAKYEPGKKVAT